MTTMAQEEIEVRATEVLAQSSVSDLRQIRVDRSAGKLQLSGRVSSFYHKQLAQETVRTVANGMPVVNHVHVAS